MSQADNGVSYRLTPMIQSRANFNTHHIGQFSNEPAVEKQLVQAFFGARKGFYVDVGANDPVLDSQPQHLEAIGWTGLLIEPDPDCCDLLRRMRSGTVIELACSGPANSGKLLQLNRAGLHSTPEERPIALGAVVRFSVAVQWETLDTTLRSTKRRMRLSCCPSTLKAMNRSRFRVSV